MANFKPTCTRLLATLKTVDQTDVAAIRQILKENEIGITGAKRWNAAAHNVALQKETTTLIDTLETIVRKAEATVSIQNFMLGKPLAKARQALEDAEVARKAEATVSIQNFMLGKPLTKARQALKDAEAAHKTATKKPFKSGPGAADALAGKPTIMKLNDIIDDFKDELFSLSEMRDKHQEQGMRLITELKSIAQANFVKPEDYKDKQEAFLLAAKKAIEEANLPKTTNIQQKIGNFFKAIANFLISLLTVGYSTQFFKPSYQQNKMVEQFSQKIAMVSCS